jgi:hypothetical protein
LRAGEEGSLSSGGKRKVTGSKRIEFETWFARLSGWADHILSRLEQGVVAKLELGNLSFFVNYKISRSK